MKLLGHYTFSSLGTPETPLRNLGLPQNPVWETLLRKYRLLPPNRCD